MLPKVIAFETLRLSRQNLSSRIFPKTPLWAMILMFPGGNASGNMDALQKASLSPMVFRGIWRRARLASEDEMTELLLARGFTEDGARQTAKIYKTNATLAQLDQLEVEPVLPERSGPNRPGRMIEEKLRQNLLSNSRGQKDAFRLPVSTGVAVIPKGISEDEFTLIIETLQMWKAQIVVS